jgi:ubiquitin C-terminal hydrolase
MSRSHQRQPGVLVPALPLQLGLPLVQLISTAPALAFNLSWDVLITASTQLMAADGLAVSIRTALPLNLVRRALLRLVRWYGRRWSTGDGATSSATSSSCSLENVTTPSACSSHRPMRRMRPRLATCQSPRGLRNHGQTCFLNSVLQALASSDPFLRFLEDVVDRSWQLHELRSRLDQGGAVIVVGGEDINNNDDDNVQSLGELVLDILLYINGCSLTSTHRQQDQPNQFQMERMVTLKVKEVLRRVAAVHAQFRPRSGGGLARIGTEQQDAQELLQALIGMIEAESASAGTAPGAPTARGSGDEASTMISAVSACQPDPINCKYRMAPDGDHISGQLLDESDVFFTLSDWLSQADKVQMGIDENVAPGTSCETLNEANGLPNPSSPLSEREEKKSEEDEMLSIGLQDATSLLIQSIQKSGKNTKEHFETETGVSGSRSRSNLPISPLTGWTGSVLQCLRCNHVRPLNNTPFLEIPIIPTAIGAPGMNPSSPLPGCSLYDCLRDFSKSERVQDVECQSCSVISELSSVEDEIMLLKGAIENVAKRSGKTKSGAEGLVRELRGLETRRLHLQSADLDQDFVHYSDEKGQDQSFFGVETEENTNAILPLPARGPAKKCLVISRPPVVLCFHVQRRYYDAATDRMVKSAQIVAFPPKIDIAPFCAYASRGSSMPYTLMSIIEHRGNAHAGHYVTYRRIRSGDGWVIVSDDSVSAISWEEVRRAQAYMLIYESCF